MGFLKGKKVTILGYIEVYWFNDVRIIEIRNRSIDKCDITYSRDETVFIKLDKIQTRYNVWNKYQRGVLLLKKKSGFISIECIMSLTILYVSVYLISTALYDCYKFTIGNESKREMLNTAKEYLEEEKYKIKNSDYPLIEDATKQTYINGYEVNSSIKQALDYYQCYEINMEIKRNTESLRFDSYVTKQ